MTEHSPHELPFRAGQYVRFKHLPGTPIRVQAVTIRGWIKLEGRQGPFNPNLFELAEAPQEKSA